MVGICEPYYRFIDLAALKDVKCPYAGFYELVQTVRVVDILDPMSRHDSGHMVALSLHRLGKSNPFSSRERVLAKLLADELTWLHETRRLNVRDLLAKLCLRAFASCWATC